MKKILIAACCFAIALIACNKANDSADQISLTASTTNAVVGQTVTVTAATNINTLSWTANPATSTTKAYGVTTEKINYFTFTQPGTYVVGVRARHMDLDSVHHCNHADSVGHHFQDSVWNHHVDSLWHGHHHNEGGCKKGADSASIIIKVI